MTICSDCFYEEEEWLVKEGFFDADFDPDDCDNEWGKIYGVVHPNCLEDWTNNDLWDFKKSWGSFFWENGILVEQDIHWRSKRPINLSTNIWKYLLGKSVGASIAPSVANVPIIGWVTMFSGNQDAEIGGGVVKDLSKNS